MDKQKSMYTVSFQVSFDIGYADGIKHLLYKIFDAFNIYDLKITENRESNQKA